MANASSAEAARLIETTRGALQAGIGTAHSGARIGDIGAAVQQFAESRGYSVVREYAGPGMYFWPGRSSALLPAPAA